MTLLGQAVATVLQMLYERFLPNPHKMDVQVLGRLTSENHQMRLLLADTAKDLEELRAGKLTKAQISDRLQVVLSRFELVKASLASRTEHKSS